MNVGASQDFHMARIALRGAISHRWTMAAPAEQIVFLQEWFDTLGKRQHALITDLGWAPQKANRIWHRLQPLRDGEIGEIAALLNIRPHELLMRPDEAMRLRRIEATMREVARLEKVADAADRDAKGRRSRDAA